MENKEQQQSSPPPPSSSSSSSSSGHEYLNNRPPQSQWLQSTSSDMDNKMKMILELIDDDGETFAKRAEMYYQKKPQLIKLLQEYHQSYHGLADKYDHLRSDSSTKAHLSPPSSFAKWPKAPLIQDLRKENIDHYNSPSTIYSPEESIEGHSASGSDSRSSILDQVQSPQNCTSIHSDNVMPRKKDENCMNLHKQDELIWTNVEKKEPVIGNESGNDVPSSETSGNRNQSHDASKRKLRGLFCLH